jgi:hypothetical protein
MPDYISVDAAISRGRKTINLPVQLIQFSIVASTIYLVYEFKLPNWIYIILIPSAVLVPWVYWSFKITKWRIWAFENVEDVHDLKQRAITAKLIWPDGNIFEKTEIRTAEDKRRLALIEKRFDQ